MQAWSNWKRFPDAYSGGFVEAPIGPGVYEVRHAQTGELVAFGHAGNVANAISALKVDHGRGWSRLFKRASVRPVHELEYRAAATATVGEAKTAASHLNGLRQSYWRKRMDLGWAARHSQH